MVFLCFCVGLAVWFQLWLVAMLVATSIYAVLTIIDLVLFKEDIYSHSSQPLVISAIFQISALVLYPFVGTGDISGGLLGVAVVSGALNMLSYALYYRAAEHQQDGALISMLWNVVLGFVPIFAFLLNGEVIHVLQYTGVFLLFAGAFLVSYDRAHASPKTVRLMLISACVMALGIVLMKGVYAQVSLTVAPNEVFWTGFFPYVCGEALVGVLAFLFLQRQHKKQLFSVTKSFLGIFILMEAAQLGAEMLGGYSLSQGPASIVAAVDGLNPVFVISFSVVMAWVFSSTKWRSLWGEVEAEHVKNFRLKFIGVILAALGAFLVGG